MGRGAPTGWSEQSAPGLKTIPVNSQGSSISSTRTFDHHSGKIEFEPIAYMDQRMKDTGREAIQHLRLFSSCLDCRGIRIKFLGEDGIFCCRDCILLTTSVKETR